MKTPSSTDLLFYLIKFLSFFVFFFLVFILQLYNNPFPYSDDWSLLSHAIGAEPLTWDWLWAQHVDHRIPIQKLLQVFLLRLSGYDFRALALINSILIFLTANFLISAVRFYRGSSQVGDFIIPLILMNPGFSAPFWGFHFQFISSTLLILVFLSFLLQENAHLRNVSYIMASICILLMAFCGINGVVPSIIISLSLLFYILWVQPIEHNPTLYAVITLLVLALMTSIIIISSWHPSVAASLPTASIFKKLYDIADNFFYLINPRPIFLVFEKHGIYFIVNSVLYVIALGFLGRKYWLSYKISRSFCIKDIAILVTLIALLSMLLSIAIGRSEYWIPGLEKHYGYLATVLPIVSWIAVSIYAPGKLRITIGLILVFLYGYSYVENAEWRIAYGKESRQKIIRIYGDISSGMMISDFVNKHNSYFYYIDNENTRQSVKNIIVMLKRTDVEPYTHLRIDSP